MTNRTEAMPVAMTNTTKGRRRMRRKMKKRRHVVPRVSAKDFSSDAPGTSVEIAGKAKANRVAIRAATTETPQANPVTANAIIG
jgi:hypothetical protein